MCSVQQLKGSATVNSVGPVRWRLFKISDTFRHDILPVAHHISSCCNLFIQSISLIIDSKDYSFTLLNDITCSIPF